MNPAHLRILMIIANFHPRVGGAERQALLLARSLRQRDIPVRVLTLRDPALPAEEIIELPSIQKLF